MAAAKADESIIDLETEMKAAIARLSELMLSYEENAAAIQDTRGRLYEARVYQSRETGDQISPATTAINSRIQSLRTGISELEQERISELQTKTENHPDISRIDELLTSLRTDLDAAVEEQQNPCESNNRL